MSESESESESKLISSLFVEDVASTEASSAGGIVGPAVVGARGP